MWKYLFSDRMLLDLVILMAWMSSISVLFKMLIDASYIQAAMVAVFIVQLPFDLLRWRRKI
jgi:uncharacterized membrane protein